MLRIPGISIDKKFYKYFNIYHFLAQFLLFIYFCRAIFGYFLYPVLNAINWHHCFEIRFIADGIEKFKKEIKTKQQQKMHYEKNYSDWTEMA